MKRPLILWPLFFIHFFVGINAITAGILMILKPDGSLLGMQPGWLTYSPFNNYVIPGLSLFLLNGIFPLFTLAGLVGKPSWKLPEFLNIYPAMHWSWTYSLYAGIIMIFWIAFQLMMTDYFWLQSVILVLGLLTIILTMIPRVIKYYKNL